MVDVGRLVEGVLLVKHRGKWRRKLCALEKQATFSSSLRLLVYDETEKECQFQDVVHAFISFLDPSRQGTLMLVCNYKVRCISFDEFSIMNKWTEVLEANLSYNYFHAELVVASRGSRLAKYAARHPGYRLFSQKRSLQSGWNPNSRARCGLSGKTCGDGYLHVTRDRICFTTGLNCARPRLLATWNFDNDEIVQCGTARLRPRSLGRKTENENESSNAVVCNGSGSASLFFLTAFPDHPEAPGSYLFLSDRATELCEWIEHNNRSAVDQAEWRRITSIAAVLECPNPTNLDHFAGLCSAWDNNLPVQPYLASCAVCNDEILCSVHCPADGDGVEAQEEGPVCSRRGQSHTTSSSGEGIPKDRSHPNPCISAPSDSVMVCTNVNRNLSTEVSAESLCLDAESGESNPTCSVANKKQAEEMHLPDARSLDFHARKLAAMYSRRRFSSHPVTAIRDSNCVSCTCTCGVKHNVSSTQCGRLNTSLQPPPSGNLHGCTHMNSSNRCGFPVSRELQWRQSEPHLVALSPLPIPSSAIQHYLARRSMCHLENECLRREGAHSATPLKDPFKFSATCRPCCPSHCREKPLTGSTVPSVREHTHLSECSTTSASDSVASSEPKCSSSVVETFASSCAALDPLPGALTAIATCVSSSRAPQTTTSHASTTYSGFRWGAYRRRRLPSSWSTTTNAGFITSELANDESASICTGADKTGHSYISTIAPSAGCSVIYGGSSFPGHSLSSGNSPQFHLTPLHPTCTVIPGSQYFTPHRRHTTSACEAVSFRSGFSSGGGAANGIGSMCSTFAHSSKASLISLTASAIPLWAEAPSKAKPRTGCNYVSREMLASLNSQRKHQHQHNNHSSPPPPPSTQHPRPSSGMGITNSPMNYPANSSTRTHPHPCTPVPEASKETETYTLPHAAELHSITAASLLSQYTESASVSSQITGRPYINMVPPSHRSGLKPIDECQLTSSDRTSNSEHPLVQCSVVEPSLISIPSCSNGPSLENTNDLGDATTLLTCASISNTGCSSNVHCSYVNFTSCVIPVNRGGHTDQNSSVCTQSSQYINIASAQNTLRPCLSDLRSGRCTSSSPIASVPPKCQCHRKESKENHAIASSVSCSSSRYCVTDSPGPERSACYTPLCLHRNHSTPVTSTESCQKERVSSTLPVSTVESTLNNTPRLYYAHLMLSNESASRVSKSPPPTSEFTSPASSRELASDSQRPNFHTLQCSPFAFPSTSVTNAQSASENMTSANDAITSSGLNYVTIDSVQTKALSELERELRGATGSESSSYSVPDPSSRRATIARTGMLSATLPGPSITSDTFSRGRAVERSSSHSGTGSGSKNGKFDGLGAWLPVRVWSRLVHSLSLHHTPSTDQNRNEKHGGQRRRANGSSKEVESVIVASTSLQN